MQIQPLLVPLAILFVPLVVFAYRRRPRLAEIMSDVVHRVPVYERVAVIAVALIPACGWGIAAVLHTGYVPRYGSAGTFGLAVLAAFTVYVLGAACSLWPRLIATGALVRFIGSFSFIP